MRLDEIPKNNGNTPSGCGSVFNGRSPPKAVRPLALSWRSGSSGLVEFELSKSPRNSVVSRVGCDASASCHTELDTRSIVSGV
jgi:hypothetical protein